MSARFYPLAEDTRDTERRILRFSWAMQESGRYSDRDIIGAALNLSPLFVHEVCADLEWRGYLRRHGKQCSGIVLSPRGEAVARSAA